MITVPSAGRIKAMLSAKTAMTANPTANRFVLFFLRFFLGRILFMSQVLTPEICGLLDLTLSGKIDISRRPMQKKLAIANLSAGSFSWHHAK
jgi:hypothetical protein